MFLKRKLKIAIVGGCQAAGLREATLRLLPKADVSSWHAGIHPPDSPEDILQKLKTFDHVISQITPGNGLEKLQMEVLRQELKSVHFMPTAVFSGFHPDMTYIFDAEGIVSAVHSDFHSKIAVAGYLLGLTPQATFRLYNTLVFAELGYFEDFMAAKTVFEQSLEAGGMETFGLVDEWLEAIGPFMYMSNHPHIQVLARMCRDLYVRSGLLPKRTPVPVVEKDHLFESFTWPVYPDLARRLGVQGSFDFHRPTWLTPAGESRNLPLIRYLGDVFEYYATIDRRRLEMASIVEVRKKLSNLLNI